MWRDLAGFVLNIDLLEEYGWRLLDGLKLTIELVVISVPIGFVLGYLVCLARNARSRLLSGLALGYTTVMRGTPLLCQLYLVYYGAGEARPFLQQIGLWWFFQGAFLCAILVFTLNTTAYQAEVLRGAILAVPKGQIEAASALGLTRFRVMRHVVWPQALLIALGPLGNELIAMIKSSAVAALVTLLDLMGQTRLIFSRTFDFSTYLYAALIYLALVEIIRRVWALAEARLTRHLRPA